MKFKIGDKVSIINYANEEYIGEILSLYEDVNHRCIVPMAKILLINTDIDNHIVYIGQGNLQKIPDQKSKPDIVTETTVIINELLRDNEKLMIENDNLNKQIDRLDKLLDIVKCQYKDLQENNSELREQIKLYRKGLSN